MANHIESISHSPDVDSFILKSYNKSKNLITKQIVDCKKKITEVIQSDSFLNDKMKKLMSIKGVGLISAITVVAETQGFANITNRKQLASYAGLDVVERQSGTSVFGKSRISKKGNSHIRRILYMPAMSASISNEEFKRFYNRVNEGKKYKKIGLVALERKILLLMFTLWKKDEMYKYSSGNLEE